MAKTTKTTRRGGLLLKTKQRTCVCVGVFDTWCECVSECESVCPFFLTLKQRIMQRKAWGNAADCIFGSLWRCLSDNLSRLSGGPAHNLCKGFCELPV